MNFVAPTVNEDGQACVEVSLGEIHENISCWNHTLVGYVLGLKPFYLHLKTCVTRLWRPTCLLEVHSRENGFFLFHFGSGDDCDRILQGGPWLFDGRLIVLRLWEADAILERDLFTSVPVRIRPPALPSQFWSQDVINKLASVVGRPLFMDFVFANGTQIAYARCFVEISANTPRVHSMKVVVPNGPPLDIPVEYEHIPPMCMECFCFGHVDSQCPMASVWKEKESIDVDAPIGTSPTNDTNASKSVGKEKVSIDVDVDALVGISPTKDTQAFASMGPDLSFAQFGSTGTSPPSAGRSGQ